LCGDAVAGFGFALTPPYENRRTFDPISMNS